MMVNGSYLGGKGQDGVYHTIINQIPPHRCYIEPFLGHGAIMLRKRPAERNIGIDQDATAIDDTSRSSRQNCLEAIDFIIGDAFDFLRSSIGIINPDTFIYCDPPYLHSTRSCDRCRYKYELTDNQHIELLDILKSLKCMVMISTYPNELYKNILAGWRTVDYTAVARSGEARTELLYMNYPEPNILHDDRYLGTNANTRQDINRRVDRTATRLLSWPKSERIKVLRRLIAGMEPDELSHLGIYPDAQA